MSVLPVTLRAILALASGLIRMDPITPGEERSSPSRVAILPPGRAAGEGWPFPVAGGAGQGNAHPPHHPRQERASRTRHERHWPPCPPWGDPPGGSHPLWPGVRAGVGVHILAEK
ncbi:MAG: hypothetical protein HQM03_19815 [Magnetococcales bacterium]|nr:hypothetical protein [Magnetococcales bacterium]